MIDVSMVIERGEIPELQEWAMCPYFQFKDMKKALDFVKTCMEQGDVVVMIRRLNDE